MKDIRSIFKNIEKGEPRPIFKKLLVGAIVFYVIAVIVMLADIYMNIERIYKIFRHMAGQC